MITELLRNFLNRHTNTEKVLLDTYYRKKKDLETKARREQTVVYGKRGGGKHTLFPPSVFLKNIYELRSEYLHNVS